MIGTDSEKESKNSEPSQSLDNEDDDHDFDEYTDYFILIILKMPQRCTIFLLRKQKGVFKAMYPKEKKEQILHSDLTLMVY